MQAGHQRLNHSPLRTSSTLPRSHSFAPVSHRDHSTQMHVPDSDRQQSDTPAHLDASAPSRFGHTFSRIQVYPTTAGLLQTKLAVSTPGDAHEQEADRLADTVLRMPEPLLARAETSADVSITSRVVASRFFPRPQALSTLSITPAAPMIQRRTLGMAGSCWFQDCQTQLQNFFMIPEDGPPGFHPSGTEGAFRVDDVDGLWYKFHTPTNEWFKIPDIGTAHVFCSEDEQAARIQPAAIVPFATAGWSDEDIHTPNPYV
ncbi:MAG TPA: hypothetical protein VGD58_05795 [Herpetosiphonaceae bacterium]